MTIEISTDEKGIQITGDCTGVFAMPAHLACFERYILRCIAIAQMAARMDEGY